MFWATTSLILASDLAISTASGLLRFSVTLSLFRLRVLKMNDASGPLMLGPATSERSREWSRRRWLSTLMTSAPIRARRSVA